MISERDLIYEVVYKDDAVNIVEEVSEHALAYADNCPVTIDCNEGEGSSMEGTVLLCESSSSDPSKVLYTVMMTDGDRCRCEVGVDPTRVRYRKVDIVPTVLPVETNVSIRKEPESANNNDRPTANDRVSVAAEDTGKGAVPSSITCDSIVKPGGNTRAGGAAVGVGNKRARVSGNGASPASATPGEKTLSGDEGPREGIEERTRSDGRGSVAPARATKGDNSNPKKAGHATRMEIVLPAWLQRSRRDQQDLFREF